MGNSCSSNESNVDNTIGMTKLERKFIKSSLEKDDDFINRGNARKRLDEFIDNLSVKYLNKGDKLFSYGDQSNELYIIAHG